LQGSFVDFSFFYQEEESKRGQRPTEEEYVDADVAEEGEGDEEGDEEEDDDE
jgi:hypothetical protein